MTVRTSIDSYTVQQAARRAQAKAIGDAIARLFLRTRRSAASAADCGTSWEVAEPTTGR